MTAIPLRAAALLRRKSGEALRRSRVWLATRRLHGRARVTLGPDEVAAVCLMKNAGFQLEQLIAHHRALGVRHFVFIDNGSTDDTVAIAARHDDVTIFRNPLPVREYETLLRARIARRAVRGGWFLFLDTDELIVPAHGEGRDLAAFTGYCRQRGYDAAACQVLDMFSDLPLSQTRGMSYAQSVRCLDRYSLHQIDAFDYHDTENIGFSWFMRRNRCDFAGIKVLFGGVRREVFGEDCCLTAHRLVRNAPHVELYAHPHASGNVTLADFTLLIRHYKFAGDFVARDRAQVAQGTWAHGEDRTRLDVVTGKDDFRILCAEPQKYRDTAQLVRQGFLACSEEFLRVFPAPLPAPGSPDAEGPGSELAAEDLVHRQ